MWFRKRPTQVFVHGDIQEIRRMLYCILQNQEGIMAAIDDIRAILTAANASIDGIVTDIQTLKDLIPASGGMTAAETDEVRTLTQSLGDRLTAVDLSYPPQS